MLSIGSPVRDRQSDFRGKVCEVFKCSTGRVLVCVRSLKNNKAKYPDPVWIDLDRLESTSTNGRK